MFEPFLKQMLRHHLLNTGCILILPILKDFIYLINLIFKLQVGYRVVFQLIVCEGQKSPYVWGKMPMWAFCPTSVRAVCLTDGPKEKIIPTIRHCILLGFKWYTRVYNIPNGYNALRATINHDRYRLCKLLISVKCYTILV